MKLSDWASIAEIIAAAGIIVSLVFVGLQLNDGNREAKAATIQAALDAEMLFQSQLIQNSDAWERVVMGGDYSDEVDTRRAIALYNMSMTLNDNRYQMMNAGYLEYSAGNLEVIVSMPFYNTWRGSPGAQGRSEQFLRFVDEMRARLVSD